MPSPYFADVIIASPRPGDARAAASQARAAVDEVFGSATVRVLRRHPASGLVDLPQSCFRGLGMSYDSRALPQQVPEFFEGMLALSTAHPDAQVVVVAINANDPSELGVSVFQSGKHVAIPKAQLQGLLLAAATEKWGERGRAAYKGRMESEQALDPAQVADLFSAQAWLHPSLATPPALEVPAGIATARPATR